MLRGSCLCGAVRYELQAEPQENTLCHCSMCRKAQESAFAANALVARRDFTLTAGAEYLKEYRSSPNKGRVFCANCGSPLYSYRDDGPDQLRLRLGTLDAPIQPENRYHTFYADKATWDETADDRPRYGRVRAGASNQSSDVPSSRT